MKSLLLSLIAFFGLTTFAYGTPTTDVQFHNYTDKKLSYTLKHAFIAKKSYSGTLKPNSSHRREINSYLSGYSVTDITNNNTCNYTVGDERVEFYKNRCLSIQTN